MMEINEKSKGGEDTDSQKNLEDKKIKSKSASKKNVALSRFKRRLFRHIWLVRAGVIIAVGAVLVALSLFAASLLRETRIGFYYDLASNFVFAPKDAVSVIDDRTNILLLGKGGQNHDAPSLTDTIVFVSVNHSKPSVSMVSLPRDIWIPELRAKINSAYYWGNQKKEGGGLALAKSSVERIVGEPVQYGVVVDFEGFREIIDVLGGVEVDVENSFTDEHFPVPGKENDECEGDPEFKCRYETISFKKGKTTMDGDTALKFARSRNADGDEGTDIARAARQQKIIDAIKRKAFSKEILFSPRKLLEIKGVVETYVETDIDPNPAAVIARKVFDARGSFYSHVLPEEFIVNPPKLPRYDNLYVFIPKDGDWSQVHEWVEKTLALEN
ncbi:MAG: LCP family protein [Candidatus Woesebacteria bacterium]|jgi:LCP family protein required for cell wall assembly